MLVCVVAAVAHMHRNFKFNTSFVGGMEGKFEEW
jgi:hypothetical protein